MCAPGAMPCTASTSSVSSPYQPCGSCFGFCGRWNTPGAVTCRSELLLSCGRPCRAEYSLASARIVGGPYASGARVPSGVAVLVVDFSPKYVEHGGALTNAGDGGADGAISALDSSRPTTPTTDPGRLAGTESSDCGARSVLPCTLYSPNAVLNVAAAWATVPSACT